MAEFKKRMVRWELKGSELERVEPQPSGKTSCTSER